MSIIVFRDGVVAADTLCVAGYTRQPGHAAKIVATPDGLVAGACGSAAFCESFKAWAMVQNAPDAGGPPEPAKPEGEDGGDIGMLYYPDGRVQLFEHAGAYFIEPPYFAVGAGQGIAYGAFYMGASAEQAVRAVIEFDIMTGGEPTILTLHNASAQMTA